MKRRRLVPRWLAGVGLCALVACTVDPDGFSGRRPRKTPTTGVPGGPDDAIPEIDDPAGALTPPAQRTGAARFTIASEDFTNPERGFFEEYDDFLATSEASMADTEAAGITLVMAIVRLDPFRSDALSPIMLQTLAQSFQQVRRHGLKVILRFSYNSPTDLDYRTAVDAALPFVRQHLGQVKPVLQENVDVIAFWQAGFIGAWGEWHNSSSNLDTTLGKQAVRDALLGALPAGRTLQIRYAADAMSWFPTLPNPEVMPGSSAAAVFGLHNDCFLSSATDVATYDIDPAIAARQRDYVRAMTAITPFGGETCNPPATEMPQLRSRCADVLSEARQYHLSYLNRDYFTPGFQDKWIIEGCYPTVAGTMGYRFELITADHAPSGARGDKFVLRFSVRNTGWARLTNPRPLHVLLRHRATAKVIDQIAGGVEPRAWLPDGKDFAVTAQIDVPLDSELGDYDVLLALPDVDPRLAPDPRYAVRWHNADDAASAQDWEPSHGRFRIGTTFEVK